LELDKVSIMRTKLRLVVGLAVVYSLHAAVMLSTPVAGASQAPESTSKPSGKIWVGRYAEFEECVRMSPVVREQTTPVGVTRPRRIYFKDGGLCGGALFSDQRTSRDSGYLESYQSRIAAYEIDKLLELDMVPPTVEREHGGMKGAAQLWVDNAVFRKELEGQRSPDIEGWNKQMRRWRVFDNFVADIDPNAGNQLVVRDSAWQLVLVDHSRAFSTITRMVFTMERIDRPFYDRLKALDKPTLDTKIGKLVLDGSRSLLRRRDIIIAHFDKLVKQKGEAAVFGP
jgi:hypothetical protein